MCHQETLDPPPTHRPTHTGRQMMPASTLEWNRGREKPHTGSCHFLLPLSPEEARRRGQKSRLALKRINPQRRRESHKTEWKKKQLPESLPFNANFSRAKFDFCCCTYTLGYNDKRPAIGRVFLCSHSRASGEFFRLRSIKCLHMRMPCS